MLTITQSHDLYRLFNSLTVVMGEKTARPLEPITILVPSLAMGRWLTYAWARRFGVCANLNIDYPARMMRKAYTDLKLDSEKSPLSEAMMQWRLFDYLDDLPLDPVYDVLKQYLHAMPQPDLGRWQLAGRIASVFSDYTNYRADWLEVWRRGRLVDGNFRHQEWQAQLWQTLFADIQHERQQHFIKFQQLLTRQPELVARVLPSRLAMFTTVRLPPQEFRFFHALSQRADLYWYHLNPCREYWADVVDERWLLKMRVLQPEKVLFRDAGHPLLAAWGKQARDNFRLLSQLAGGEQDNDWLDDFPDINGQSLLRRLQRSINELDHRDDLTPEQLWPIHPDDNSLQVHSCHSLTRQLEVLHDQLVRLFSQRPDLKPDQVMVMLPDIANASGAIEAVFGTAPEDRRIAWQFTGVASPEENGLWAGFSGLYQLAQGRLPLSEFIDWLALAPVANYYQLSADDIAAAAELLRQAAVYRGLDGEHRATVTQDATDNEDTHTLLFGLERLLLGTVLPADFQEVYAGIQPVSGLEASQFELIGRLTQAVSDLTARRALWQQRLPLSEWLLRLQHDLQQFFIAEVGSRPWEVLQDALNEMQEAANQAQYRQPLSLFLLMHDLAARTANMPPGSVPAGTVQFSRIGSLRGLPYRVIAVLGLEDSAFPRRDRPQDFDLLAQDQHPRAGDRSRRDDDKGAFLEGLMAARQHLLLFYNGSSNYQDSQFPPSVVVSELLDYLGRRAVGGKLAIEKHCVRRHRLQVFSPVYFQHKPLTFAREWLPAAQAVLRGASQENAFINQEVPLDPHWQQLTINALYDFYRHPARYFLRRRLKLRLQDLPDQLHDEEPLRLDGLAQWQLRQQLLLQSDQDTVRASGQLPVGSIGQVYWQKAQQQLMPLRQALQRLQRDENLAYYQCELAGYSVMGEVLNAQAPYQLGYQLSQRQAKHILQAWLKHLFWQLSGGQGATYWLFLNAPIRFAPLSRSQAEAFLTAWLTYFGQGLQKPLLLAAEVAWVYAEERIKNTGNDELWAKVGKAWRELVENDTDWQQILTVDEQKDLPKNFPVLVEQLYVPLRQQLTVLAWGELP